ncbi:hypothetical protein [Microbispora sp. CA-102843]|uniref:hypothetical protein n=1 Tax=Microbispora sp. CA-102843 TaxID=3239952 RepID=UPI003D8A1B94
MTAEMWRFRRQDLGEEISAVAYEADTGNVPVIVASLEADRSIIAKIKDYRVEALTLVPGIPMLFDTFRKTLRGNPIAAAAGAAIIAITGGVELAVTVTPPQTSAIIRDEPAVDRPMLDSVAEETLQTARPRPATRQPMSRVARPTPRATRRAVPAPSGRPSATPRQTPVVVILDPGPQSPPVRSGDHNGMDGHGRQPSTRSPVMRGDGMERSVRSR